MQTLFQIFLVLHITGGAVGLLSGTINIIRKKGDKKHKLIGKFFLYGMLLAGFSALVLSVLHPNYFLFIVGVFTLYIKLFLQQEKFGIVFVVFGFISLRFVYTDWQNYTGKAKEKNYWLLAHLQRMTGAYIASLTAFLVVNKILPGIIVWLLPTVILTPLIIVWTRKYRVGK